LFIKRIGSDTGKNKTHRVKLELKRLNRSKTFKKVTISNKKKSFFAKDDGDVGSEWNSSEDSSSCNVSKYEPNDLSSSFYEQIREP
jgi:hypothetical protein